MSDELSIANKQLSRYQGRKDLANTSNKKQDGKSDKKSKENLQRLELEVSEKNELVLQLESKNKN